MNYLIYGQETYLIKQQINQLIAQQTDASVHQFDASEKGFDLNMIIHEANKLNFFSLKTILIIQNCTFLKAKGKIDEQGVKNLSTYLKSPNPDCDLLFILNLSEDEKVDSRKKIYKTLVEYCEVFKYESLKPQAFQNYVLSTTKKAQVKMSREAIQLFISCLPNDLLNFHHELDKLVLLNKKIEVTDIEKLITPVIDEKIFNLIHHLTRKNAALTMKSFDDLCQMNQDPIAFIYSMASLYRFIFKVKVLLNKNMSNKEIISTLKQNPFYVENTIKTAQLLPIDQILNTLSSLCELDILFKTDATLDRILTIELFLLRELNVCNR